jgi:hypothetical protein
MDRRAFLAGLALTAGGLLVPGPLVVPERRVWALGRWRELDVDWPTIEAAVAAVVETQRQRREWAETFRATITLGVEDGAWRVVEAGTLEPARVATA